MATFTVNNQNLLSDFLPGLILTLQQPLLPSDPMVRAITSALKPATGRLRAVPVEIHQRDIAIHASVHNTPGSCARVPIHLSLQDNGTVPTIGDTTSSSPSHVTFTITSQPYNPDIYTNETSINIQQALGLGTSLCGLTVHASTPQGLLEGCKWLASCIGQATVAEASFREYNGRSNESNTANEPNESNTANEPNESNESNKVCESNEATKTNETKETRPPLNRAIPTFTYAIKEQAPSIRAQDYADMLQALPLHQRVHMVPYDPQDSGKTDSFSSTTPTSPTPTHSADFVWQNKSTSDYQQLRRDATVYNHLCGGNIFEDKAKLALLLSESNVPENALESYVFGSVLNFSTWCKNTRAFWKQKLWVAKTPLGNSGSGVWMLSSANYNTVTQEIVSSMGDTKMDSRYAVVVQEYVLSPMLFQGRKLQFRIYCLIMGDMSCWIYRHGMLQFCNKQYTSSSVSTEEVLDDEVHITNVCRNVHNEALFLREKPVDLVSRYPQVYNSMKRSLVDLVDQASSFLKEQRSHHHFEFIGVDYIVDTHDMSAKLIECNCPPNNTGSDPVGTIEDFHKDLWEDIMHGFVMLPILKAQEHLAQGGGGTGGGTGGGSCETRLERLQDPSTMKRCDCGMFEKIRNGGTSSGTFAGTREPSDLAMNQLAWLFWEKKAAKLNSIKAMAMAAEAV